MKDKLTQKTFKGLFDMSIGVGAQFIIQFVLLIVLARLLSPTDFGLVNTSVIIVTFLSIFSMAGVGQAIIQRSNIAEEHISTGFTISILLNSILAVITFSFSPLISQFFDMDELEIIVKTMSLIFIFQGLSTVAESIMTRDLKLNVLSKIQIVSYLLYAIVGITMALLGFGVWSLVSATLVQYGIRCILLLILQPHSKKMNINKQAFKDLFIFGGGFTLARIFNQIAVQGDNFVVSKFLGVQQLGIYSRAYQLMAVPVTLFGKILDVVLFSSMSKIQNDTFRLSQALLKGVSLVSILAIPSSFIFIYYSGTIIGFLFGSKWEGVIIPFSILAAGIFFRSSYKICDSLIQAKGAVYQRAKYQIVFATLVLITSAVGSIWGLNGVSIGVLISIIINYILMSNLALKLLNMSWITYLNSQKYGFRIGIYLIVILILVSHLISSIIDSKIIVFCTVSIILISILLFSIRKFPNFFLGKDGMWFVSFLFKKLKKNKNKK
ncbi:lipopolysaccharide biosynthesis protein [Terribacillus saccharophilus]|uniref:lipopolysaccharide biosynthesis protein n=1 Tax=Terribacillus saccharophilus TaxID=361277 RepID=UPI003982C997